MKKEISELNLMDVSLPSVFSFHYNEKNNLEYFSWRIVFVEVKKLLFWFIIVLWNNVANLIQKGHFITC